MGPPHPSLGQVETSQSRNGAPWDCRGQKPRIPRIEQLGRPSSPVQVPLKGPKRGGDGEAPTGGAVQNAPGVFEYVGSGAWLEDWKAPGR